MVKVPACWTQSSDVCRLLPAEDESRRKTGGEEVESVRRFCNEDEQRFSKTLAKTRSLQDDLVNLFHLASARALQDLSARTQAEARVAVRRLPFAS